MNQSILIQNWWISSQLVVEEAEKMKLNVDIISKNDNFFSVSNWAKTIYFKSIDCWLNSSIWLKIANNKELTYKLAEKNNIRVPKSIYIDKNKNAYLNIFLENLQYPVITKPIDGAHGDGVAINLNTKEELNRWIEYSFSWENVSRIVIQEQIQWDDHRILVINWKVISVTKRIPPYIIGDGKLSISQLIQQENLNPKRRWGVDHDAPMSKIKIDNKSIDYLNEQWYNSDSILKIGIQVSVRRNANLSTWGLAIDVTSIIHPSIAKQAEKISRISWLWFCGVDYFCNDISESLDSGKWAIIEINATPGIRMHHFPNQWTGQNIAKILLDLIFKK